MLAVSQTARHDASAATPDFSSRSSRPSHPDCRCTPVLPETENGARHVLPVARTATGQDGAGNEAILTHCAEAGPAIFPYADTNGCRDEFPCLSEHRGEGRAGRSGAAADLGGARTVCDRLADERRSYSHPNPSRPTLGEPNVHGK